MSIPPSSAINLPLPRWAYAPGETGEADHDTLWQAKALVPSRFRDRRGIRRCAMALRSHSASAEYEAKCRFMAWERLDGIRNMHYCSY